MAWISVNSIGYEIRKDLCFVFLGAVAGAYLAREPLKSYYENASFEKAKKVYEFCEDELEDQKKIQALEKILYEERGKND